MQGSAPGVPPLEAVRCVNRMNILFAFACCENSDLLGNIENIMISGNCSVLLIRNFLEIFNGYICQKPRLFSEFSSTSAKISTKIVFSKETNIFDFHENILNICKVCKKIDEELLLESCAWRRVKGCNSDRSR